MQYNTMQYNRMDSKKKSAIIAQASAVFDHAIIAQASAVFDHIDTNGDGKISRQELELFQQQQQQQQQHRGRLVDYARDLGYNTNTVIMNTFTNNASTHISDSLVPLGNTQQQQQRCHHNHNQNHRQKMLARPLPVVFDDGEKLGEDLLKHLAIAHSQGILLLITIVYMFICLYVCMQYVGL